MNTLRILTLLLTAPAFTLFTLASFYSTVAGHQASKKTPKKTGRYSVGDTDPLPDFSVSPAKRIGEWILFAETDDEALYYSPKRLRRVSPKVVQGWIRSIPTIPSPYGKAYELQLEQCDCTQEKRRLIAWVSYKENGRVIFSQDYRNPAWVVVIPDSIGEAVFAVMCTPRDRWKPKVNPEDVPEPRPRRP